MKKHSKIVFSLLVAALAVFMFTGCGYNNMVSLREEVDSQWANVENRYQERYDLVPNLVATVKGYASHEEAVYTEIAEARSKLGGSVTIDSSITEDPQAMERYIQSQNQLGNSLGRLLALTEAYPELKANENFLDLQSQLEGIENRIATERKRYNDAVKQYNSTIQKFPGVITARIFGFTSKQYFKAESSAYQAPKVEF